MSTQQQTATYRKAPPGFTREQWETFDRDGILIIEDAIDADAVDHYRAAIDRLAAPATTSSSAMRSSRR